jgi:DNA-binding response OmpR family regulator
MARILVVDDDVSVLCMIEAVLTGAGHSVVTATDGQMAAKLFRAEPFDVIVTDIVMPNREGLETIVELRRDFPDVPVIAMSGGTLNSGIYLGLAKRLGAKLTLAKPFPTQELVEAVAAVQAPRE